MSDVESPANEPDEAPAEGEVAAPVPVTEDAPAENESAEPEEGDDG